MSTCSNGFGCDASAAPPACYSSCLNGSTPDDTRCAAPGYCRPDGTCALRGGPGAACSANSECTSNVCGTTGVGSCCEAACKTGGPCGATGCDASGKCIYPANGTQCGSSCPAGSNVLTVSTCDGAGECKAGTGKTCANEYMCNSSGTACATSCPSNDAAGDQYCTILTWCDGSICRQDVSPAASCSRANQCNGWGDLLHLGFFKEQMS